MPNMNRTGPQGQGPMTGRGMGPCGRGIGRYGRGFGRGFSRGFQPQFVQPVQYSEADEKKILQEELREIEAEKAEIQKRLKETR